MLSRLRRARPVLTSVNYTPEHASLAKTIGRRKAIVDGVAAKLPYLRVLLVLVGVGWLLALPHERMWKGTYVDEHAIQPAQVTMYFDWADVHRADRHLDELERLVNMPFEERSSYISYSFAAAGLSSGNTSAATYAHVKPPRSAGTETILLSANWVSRDGVQNLRGVAMLLALANFLRGQNHWAFDFVLVIGDGYLEGIEGFMRHYHELFPGVIWTGLNIDYPGHSFSHLGLFYEGVNGRLPNQDIVNTVAHVARYAGGVSPRYHDFPDERGYLLAAKRLISHFSYAGLGRPSGAHGVLARHRIDSLTLYCTPATGPHGFHTLGRTLESTLRSFNNLLERLHASYFFYLLPKQDRFIPVGHYLPIAILFGASVTLGGFDCPAPLSGVFWLLPAFTIGLIGWLLQTPLVSFVALAFPRPKGPVRTSMTSLAHLLFGAVIPTLAMVNFPQAILLAAITITYLTPWRWARLTVLAAHPALLGGLKEEWLQVGNLTWVGVFAVWVPLWVISAMI